jgi:ribosomal protein L39E
MTAAELLDNLNRAGATLEIVDDRPHIRGAKISEELIRAIKENRAEVLAELERRRTEDRDRYARVPPAEAPMLAFEMHLQEPWKEQVIAHVLRQPRPVHAWVMARANNYFEHGVKAEDCEWRACVDVIAWQRACGGLDAVKFVVELPTNEELGL